MLFVPSSSANGFKISDLRKLTQCIIQAAFETGGFNRVVHSIMKYDLFTIPCPKLNDCTSLGRFLNFCEANWNWKRRNCVPKYDQVWLRGLTVESTTGCRPHSGNFLRQVQISETWKMEHIRVELGENVSTIQVPKFPSMFESYFNKIVWLHRKHI